MSDRIAILDKGYIQILDSMGTDLDIARSARISYGKQDQDRTQEQDVILQPNERKLIGTGIAIELLSHFEAQIRTRSGLALKRGLVVANGVGTIDADYRGEIGVILHNISNEPQAIQHGDRIAQMVISEFVRVDLELVEKLAETDRGNAGFGSTGV